MKFFLLYTFSFFTAISFASPHVGIIVKKQGSVDLYTNGSKKFMGGRDVILLDGIYYITKKAKPGLRINNGDIVITGKDAKARVVYKNGDQFNIGEGSAFNISWEKDSISDRESSTIKLIRGSIRGIISKKGPRNNLTVKSKSAVMGVRGTDFHFIQKGTSGKTAISVLRGQVEVSTATKQKETQKITQGFSAELQQLNKKDSPSTFILEKTSKAELIEIQKESKIEKVVMNEVISGDTKKELASLESAAIKTTMEDIKEYQPEVYKELAEKKITQIETINTIVVSKAFQKAPQKKIKKSIDQLDLNLNDDAYKKYFKIEESI